MHVSIRSILHGAVQFTYTFLVNTLQNETKRRVFSSRANNKTADEAERERERERESMCVCVFVFHRKRALCRIFPDENPGFASTVNYLNSLRKDVKSVCFLFFSVFLFMRPSFRKRRKASNEGKEAFLLR